MSLEDDLEELESAEDFLQYFSLDYNPSVVHVNRLHILQRFHDYIAQAGDSLPEEETPKRVIFSKLLQRAYDDFVTSTAQDEKVFKVFKTAEGSVFVGLDEIQS